MIIEFDSHYQNGLWQSFTITKTGNSYKINLYSVKYVFRKKNGQYYMPGNTLVDNKDFLHALKLFDRKLKLKKLLK